MRLSIITTAIFLALGSQAHSSDIVREVKTQETSDDSFFEFGISLATGKFPLIGLNLADSVEESDDVMNGIAIGLEGRFAYKGFFIEAIQENFSGITLGYKALESDHARHEVVLSTLFTGADYSDIEGFESIEERDVDINLGLRSNYYLGNNFYQVELMNDVSSARNGLSGSLQVGRTHQVRNWNLHGLVGLRYLSDEMVNNLLGVSEDEASDTIVAYTADDALMPSIQVGATLPLNEHWVFRTTGEYVGLPDAMSNSPLAQGDEIYSVQAGFYRTW